LVIYSSINIPDVARVWPSSIDHASRRCLIVSRCAKDISWSSRISSIDGDILTRYSSSSIWDKKRCWPNFFRHFSLCAFSSSMTSSILPAFGLNLIMLKTFNFIPLLSTLKSLVLWRYYHSLIGNIIRGNKAMHFLSHCNHAWFHSGFFQ